MATQTNQQQTLCAILLLLVGCRVMADADGQTGLSVYDSKPCGERQCGRGQFCSPVDDLCRNCREICDPTSHNVQRHTCESQCQDFLHDERYLLRNDQFDINPGTLERVQLISTLSLILSLLALVGLAAASLLYFIYCKKVNIFSTTDKKKKKKKEEPLKLDITRRNSTEISTIKLPTADTTIDMTDIGLAGRHVPRTPQTEYTNLSTFKNPHARERSPEHTPPTPQSGTTVASGKTSVTPLAKRHPSEDSTLDAYAYDNHALAPSPVLPNSMNTGTSL